MTGSSDIDIMVRLDRSMTITFFDLADIVHELEKLANRKVDLVEEGQIKDFAVKNAVKDMIKIY